MGDTTWTMPGGGMGPQKLRVDLSLSIGENKEYYKRMVKEDKLSGLQLQVVQLSDQISQIQKAQDFGDFELARPLVGRPSSHPVRHRRNVANDSYALVLFEKENCLSLCCC